MWNGIDQRIKAGNVVTVCCSRDDRERDAMRIGDEVVFAAELAPGPWDSGRRFLRQYGSNRAVAECSRGVDFATVLQFGQVGQERFTDALPDAGLLPTDRPSPASHA